MKKDHINEGWTRYIILGQLKMIRANNSYCKVITSKKFKNWKACIAKYDKETKYWRNLTDSVSVV